MLQQTEPIAPRIDWPAAHNKVPREVFSREDIYRTELERIFYGPVWHVVGHRAEIATPGSFKTFTLGELPLLITHGLDGRINALINACSHRGTALETAPYGNAKGMVCPYHRWAFDLRGELQFCPGEEAFPADFDKKDYALRRPRRVEEFRGIIFVTMHAATPPLHDFLGEALESLDKAMCNDGRLIMLGAQRAHFNCNWKYYTDNGHDGYHPPLLHKAFALLNWQGGKGYHIETDYGHSAFEYETSAYQDNGYLKDPTIVDKRKNAKWGNRVGMIAPATVFSDHLDTLGLRFLIPRGPHDVEVHYTYFAHQDESEAYRQHRIRQSSNLLGPSGFISLDDGAVFGRQEFSTGAGGEHSFLKGVLPEADPYRSTQNDELGGTLYWARYRTLMGL